MLSDIEIAQANTPDNILNIAQQLGIDSNSVEVYGKDKAKIHDIHCSSQKKGKLILVSAINPTPAGEGKTTVSIGLADALHRLNKKAIVALRQPSLGPVFGMKGGAAGGGYSQVVPMEEINLHFTGDFHALTAANNLLSALLDNHIQHGNALNIDPRRITWKRVMDMNDRQLRNIVCGLGGKVNGMPREDHFQLTVASEIMAIFCLSLGLEDLKSRLGRIIVAHNYEGQPVTAADLKAQGAMAALLKDACKPNLVQTLEHTPAFIHGGPFANIAHGCNSILATNLALKYGEYAITEAGFGADLGAEKFLDIKCRLSGLSPSAVVIVATVKALKYHGGLTRNQWSEENLEALERGLPNLLQHLENIQKIFKLPTVVAINRFSSDTEAELELIKSHCQKLNVNVALADVWGKGGEGGLELAKEVIRISEQPSKLEFLYPLEQSIEQKVTDIATKLYRAKGVVFSDQARKSIASIVALSQDKLPICMAKTQYSFSDNPQLIGTPRDFEIHVRDVQLFAGAGFIVVYTGDIMTMPGLPSKPNSEKIDIDKNGKISGLF